MHITPNKTKKHGPCWQIKIELESDRVSCLSQGSVSHSDNEIRVSGNNHTIGCSNFWNNERWTLGATKIVHVT